MILRGIDRLIINVPDMEKAKAFFVDMVGMKIIASGEMGKDLLQLWQVPEGTTGRSICVCNPKQSTAVELMHLTPTPKETVRGDSFADFGFVDIAYGVSSAEKTARLIAAQGYSFFSPPHQYHIDYPDTGKSVDVIEGLPYGPGRCIIAILEFLSPSLPPESRLSGDFWTMFDMASVVENMESALVFYRDALGLTVVTDFLVPERTAVEMLHLPGGTTVRLVGFNVPESSCPMVELIEISVKGKEIVSSAKKLGIFMMSLETDNLDKELAAVKKRGFRVLSGPATVNTARHGKVLAANIEGPSKLRVELFQK